MFFQYISLPTKYTISGGTLQYKVGLTLSFLSLISRGVGGIQNGNASIVLLYSFTRYPGPGSSTVLYGYRVAVGLKLLYPVPGIGSSVLKQFLLLLLSSS